eukprot:TRINITY_DN2670_c0_g5_i2.p1 TRINITY_DN2670_c0_g5~~TRINITY_DN2670_c0_g5_i2.p1  ORF type:complete len:201 (-),score=35.63 TRINITY_DN2670_c0_g5_i2:45-647(-)
MKAFIYGSFAYQGPSVEAILKDCAVQFPWLNTTGAGIVQREGVYHIYCAMNPADITKWRVSNAALDTLVSEEAKEIRKKENNVKKQLLDAEKKLGGLINNNAERISIEYTKLNETIEKGIKELKSKAIKLIETEFHNFHEVQSKLDPTIQCELAKSEGAGNALKKMEEHIKECKYKGIHKQLLERILTHIIAWMDKIKAA